MEKDGLARAAHRDGHRAIECRLRHSPRKARETLTRPNTPRRGDYAPGRASQVAIA